MKRITFNEMFAISFCLFFGGISSVAFLLLSSSSSYAATTQTASASVTVGSACTLSAVENTAHSATIPSGTNQSDIGQTTFTMVCNDSGGFSLYAIGYGSNELGNTKLVAVINGATAPGYDINTGTNASGTPSSWAMKLTPGTNLTASNILNGYGSYSAIPSSYTKVATLIPTTSIIATSSLSATYRVNIAATQPAGNYNGKVRFVMVNPENATPLQPQTTQAGQICYYPNGSGTLGSMGCQTIPSSGNINGVSPTSAILLASNFSREGYGFAGWSTTYDYSDPEGFYGPQEYIEFESGAYSGNNSGLSLYAHWVKSAGSLQEWSGCSALQEGAVTALTDQRDNETYAVAKLADGKCWMIENLRLENTATTGATNIALAQGYETGFTGLADPEGLALFANVTTANSLYSIDGSTTNTISGDYLANRFPRYNNVNTPANPTNVSDRPSNPTTNSATNSTSNAGMYSYGNYYTWAAAVANTTEASIGDYNTKSICPKGWSLPRGGNKSREATNDFWNLIVTHLNNGTNPANYESSTQPSYFGSAEAGPVANALRAYPNNFVYSGYIYSGSLSNRGSNFRYRSSTAFGGNLDYDLYFDGTLFLYPGTAGGNKNMAESVRCITTPAT
ncbi:hypothetical protein J6V85_00480 [Candidatus Saccharibacteria bacterium]|nr:hypothetical protein [Candidatus Saccharibacteria bacterium]